MEKSRQYIAPRQTVSSIFPTLLTSRCDANNTNYSGNKANTTDLPLITKEVYLLRTFT